MHFQTFMLTLGYLFALMIVVKHGQGRQGVLYPKLWERRGSYSVVDEDDQRAFLKSESYLVFELWYVLFETLFLWSSDTIYLSKWEILDPLFLKRGFQTLYTMSHFILLHRTTVPPPKDLVPFGVKDFCLCSLMKPNIVVGESSLILRLLLFRRRRRKSSVAPATAACDRNQSGGQGRP